MIEAAIVDASVAVKWVVQEPGSDRARWLAKAKLEAPDLLSTECANVLWKYGKLWVDAGGRPDGHLEPPATRLVLELVPEPEPRIVGPEYKKMLDELGAMGITTVSTQLTDGRLKAYQWLESQGQMTIRMAYGKATDFGTFEDLKTRTKQLAGSWGPGPIRSGSTPWLHPT